MESDLDFQQGLIKHLNESGYVAHGVADVMQAREMLTEMDPCSSFSG